MSEPLSKLTQYKTVAKFDRRKILLENLANLTVQISKSATNRRWKLVIFACWASDFVFRNSFNMFSQTSSKMLMTAIRDLKIAIC